MTAMPQDLQPITRARMAQLSLPDIRAYAKAYRVPADAIEHGTVDELLDCIFKLRPRYPEEYPTHIFTQHTAHTQKDCDGLFPGYKPYSMFAHRRTLAGFPNTTHWTSRPVPAEGEISAGEASEERYQVGRVRDREPPAQYQDPPAIDQPVAPSSIASTNEQHTSPVVGLRERLRQMLAPSRPILTNQKIPPAPLIPSGSGTKPPQRLSPGSLVDANVYEHPVFVAGGNLSPCHLSHDGNKDLITYTRGLGRGDQSPLPPFASRIIVDDELFDLEFTPDMTKAGKEAVIRERYGIAMSNRRMVEQMLAEAEEEGKQALWKLAVLQPQIYAAHEDTQEIISRFRISANHCGSGFMGETISGGENLAENAWGFNLNDKRISSEDDGKEEARVGETVAPPSYSPTRKRVRGAGEGEPEYVDEDGRRSGALGPDLKRPRVESRETSPTPSSPSPKRKAKGKGRAFIAEDRHTLPFPSSSSYIPPIPRFGSESRRNMYDPAVPKPSEAEGKRQPNSERAEGQLGGERQICDDVTGEAGGCNQIQRPLRGAPLPAQTQPRGGSRRGNPWDVLHYDRVVWQGCTVKDHKHMPSELKRPVNWLVMGLQHPKGASYREWDDELEEQNPWRQDGRPI